MKCQHLFSLKNKKKKSFEFRLLQILLGALRVKHNLTSKTACEASAFNFLYYFQYYTIQIHKTAGKLFVNLFTSEMFSNRFTCFFWTEFEY